MIGKKSYFLGFGFFFSLSVQNMSLFFSSVCKIDRKMPGMIMWWQNASHFYELFCKGKEIVTLCMSAVCTHHFSILWLKKTLLTVGYGCVRSKKLSVLCLIN